MTMDTVMPVNFDNMYSDTSCRWTAADDHVADYEVLAVINDMRANDAIMGSFPGNAEFQELAEVLRGVLDGQQPCSNSYTQPYETLVPLMPDPPLQFSDDEISCCIVQRNYLHNASSNYGGALIPLAAASLTASNILGGSPNHSAASSCSAQLNDDQEALNQENLLPDCINSRISGAALQSPQHFDHQRLIINDGPNRSAKCCKTPVMPNLQANSDAVSIAGVEYGHGDQAEATAYESLSSPSKEVRGIYHSEIANLAAIQEKISCRDSSYGVLCDRAGAMQQLIIQREAAYAAAALRPVDWAGILSATAGARPKRRNVRISHDPQTATARRRRERISDRIRILQRLVPGATRMDTASMLDEAIHYLKYLKSQVEALEWWWLERGSASACDHPSLVTCTSLLNTAAPIN